MKLLTTFVLCGLGLLGHTSASGAAPAAATAAAAAAVAEHLATAATATATAATPVFGAQMFSGRFGGQSFTGFNPDYQIAVGDRISVRLWGAFAMELTQGVDAQGNIFLHNLGPIRVQGVRNGELNAQVQAHVKRVFRANVSSYASLDTAQPVKIYVTGYVKHPGLYNGVSSNSVLHYLDQAGGIDAERGSYLQVDVLRAGRLRTRFNLYRFLTDGQIEHIQFQDGDTVVAHPRQHAVKVSGEAFNPFVFELEQASVPASELIALARPKPGATHLSIVRKLGATSRSEYHALADTADVRIADGDEVTFTSDKSPGTILVRIEGAHQSERTQVLPYGATLGDALARVRPLPQANLAALQLFRRSVATRQRESLETSLRSLETYALTARSATSEEAALRTREADLILKFIERAGAVQPRGQVVLDQSDTSRATTLEDGDTIRIPERSSLVLVSGEVLFPNAVVHDAKARVTDYVQKVGGFNQGADQSRLIVLHQDGSATTAAESAGVQPGDEIMVLPKIDTKRIEITRGITQIIYQIAVAAKVLLAL
ncbi:polysaccharide biosynthesis/export family protein [Sphaerotilus sp.]|uniref:polysaccharide biosynthesis/export family protein n=1 Tax=Sphaerotilus sp. TaxID=2093942 RepID=UPI0025EC32B3|nr:polysaccharide biosynthesis/export family protein [Sphaerotilus sp.]